MWDWQKWKYENRDKIKHIVGYEEKFVDEILSQIPEISPDDVIAQYPFKDNKSGNRYIDFMIINKRNNIVKCSIICMFLNFYQKTLAGMKIKS